jgi:taurine dioxygenase
MMKVDKLSEVAGLRISEIDLGGQVDEATAAELMRLYNEHGLLVFTAQQLSKRQLVQAGRFFGGTEMRPPADAGDTEEPGMSVISTRGYDGSLTPDENEKIVGDIGWHTDQTYTVNPNRGKLLYAVDVPKEGGMTGFLDGELAYDALPASLQARIEGLTVNLSWDHAQATIARNRAYRSDGENELAAGRFGDIGFPVAMPHPITGRKSLYIPPLWAAGIVEMPGAEGRALLDELTAHATQPQFIYWHPYLQGDVAIWDNWRFLHAAGGTPRRYVRTLWSVVVQGGPIMGRELAKAA